MPWTWVAVTGHEAVVVRVGAHQVGEHFRVAGVGLAAADVVALPVAGPGLGVERVHPVAGRDQRRDPQTVVGLDPDRHLLRVLRVFGDQRVEGADPGHSLGESPGGQLLASWFMTWMSW
jgi:hypothetical protein